MFQIFQVCAALCGIFGGLYLIGAAFLFGQLTIAGFLLSSSWAYVLGIAAIAVGLSPLAEKRTNEKTVRPGPVAQMGNGILVGGAIGLISAIILGYLMSGSILVFVFWALGLVSPILILVSLPFLSRK